MAITPEERQRRRKFLGSSDISKIVGCHFKENIADCYYQKTELLEEERNGGGSREAKMGIHLEGAILDMFEDATGVTLERNIWLQHSTEMFCANLDAAICDEGDFPPFGASQVPRPPGHLGIPLWVVSPVEAKSTRYIEFWGDEFQEAPVQVVVQVQWQMFLAGPQCRRAYAPVFFPKFRDFGFEHVAIARDNDLIEELEFAGREFMNAVRHRRLPKSVAPTLDTLKRVKREPESVISIGEDGVPIVEKWREIKEKISFVKSDDETMKELVLALLQNAEAGRLPDGAMLTFMEQNGSRHCDVDLLEFKLGRFQDEIDRAISLLPVGSDEALRVLEGLDAEGLYKTVVRQSKHRTLRYRKAPKFKGRKRR